MTEKGTPAVDTFQRVEDKYAMTAEQAREVIRRCGEYIQKDRFFRYPVYSIYCDSDGADLVIRSLMKTGYKAKLRLRSYGNPDHSPIFLETKKKWGDIVYKKRIMLEEQEAYEYLRNGRKHHVHNNTAGEIDYMIRTRDLKPKVFIAYDRICYSAVNEDDVRITFDMNIRYRLNDLDLHENGSEKKLDCAEVMMEVKAMNRYPMWLTKILSDMKLYQSSFSKYGTIYSQNRNEMCRVPESTGRYASVYTEKENMLCSVQY